MPFNFHKIEGVLVVLEKEHSNESVGILTQTEEGFLFEYDQAYLRSPSAIPLGPEMPLTRRFYRSEHLFRPFTERIPSRDNPAYPEYCASTGISPIEDNPLILLTTIAARGPSSFLFRPIYQEVFTREDLKRFRQNLGLSVREFAKCFDFSQPGVTRVETGQTDGREILRRTEIYASYPDIALDQLRRRAAFLHRDKLLAVKKRLKSGYKN